MSLAGDIVVSAVLAIIIACVQLVTIELLGPSTQLYDLASQASNLNGADRAEFWYQALVMWVPAGGYLICAAFPIVRAYRRQRVTASRPPR